MRFEGARGGHWSIWAHDKTHRMGQAEFDLPVGGRVSIDAPLDTKDVSVRGRFVDDHGRPRAGVEVWTTCWTLPFGAKPDGTRELEDYRLGAREVRTDAEGRFELADLHPGRHVLTFNARGGVIRFFFVVVPEGGAPVIDVGDVAQSDEAWALPFDKFLSTTPEGVVVRRPDGERRRFHRAHGLKEGDLLVAIDGQALGEADDSLAFALLEGPQWHDLLVRGPHHEVRVSCPPGKPGMHLPFRRGRYLPGQGTDYSMIVEPLAPDHPWHDCLEPDDWVVAVSTDPKVQRGVSGSFVEPVDAALASGVPVNVFVRRRGPPRHVMYPVR
jgi:hypothetical protein